jgi:hypothetical protein
MGTGPDHRGAPNDMAEFARKFIEARLAGFEKDMKICLRAEKIPGRKSTYAYFPALMNCCGTLEYLASLYLGRTSPCGDEQLARYTARFMPQPEYSRDMLRVLLEAFRHPVAHRGIASGVWVDRNPANGNRRVTWKLGTQSKPPALALKEENGALKKDSPWPCRFTHRMHIHLGRLWRDVRESALKSGGLCDVVASDPAVLRNFERVMRHLYPSGRA